MKLKLCAAKTKLRGFSPQANYTDRTTAVCRRCECQLLLTEGAVWSAQWIPTAVNLSFLDLDVLLFHLQMYKKDAAS
jgi:hypothetical protein